MSPPSSQPRPVHKFFAGSHPQYQHTLSADSTSEITPTQSSNVTSPQAECTVLSIPATNIVSSAHHGYVYCMAVSPSPYSGSDDILYADPQSCVYLVTGSGDESVKVSATPSCRTWLTGRIVVELFLPLAGPPIHLRVQPRRRSIYRSEGGNDLCWMSGRIHQGVRS